MDITILLDEDYPYYLRRSPEHDGWKIKKIHKGTP